MAYDLVLVTRNLKDYTGTGICVLNPWELSYPLCFHAARSVARGFSGHPRLLQKPLPVTGVTANAIGAGIPGRQPRRNPATDP